MSTYMILSMVVIKFTLQRHLTRRSTGGPSNCRVTCISSDVHGERSDQSIYLSVTLITFWVDFHRVVIVNDNHTMGSAARVSFFMEPSIVKFPGAGSWPPYYSNSALAWIRWPFHYLVTTTTRDLSKFMPLSLHTLLTHSKQCPRFKDDILLVADRNTHHSCTWLCD